MHFVAFLSETWWWRCRQFFCATVLPLVRDIANRRHGRRADRFSKVNRELKEKNMKNTLTYRHRIPNLFNALPADFSELLERFGNENVDGTEWFAPATNLAETDDHYEISLDIAGMQSEDFDIEVKDGQLLVTGERKDEAEQERKTWHRKERVYGKFHRAFSLGKDVDTGSVDACYSNGVLSIRVPKIPERQARKITVKNS